MPAALAWIAIKDAIVAATGWSRDGLHVALGLALFLGVAAWPRARTGSLTAWIAVLVVALTNEALDLHDDVIFSGAPGYAESCHDVAYTMMLPTLVLLWTHTLLAFARDRRPQHRSMRV